MPLCLGTTSGRRIEDAVVNLHAFTACELDGADRFDAGSGDSRAKSPNIDLVDVGMATGYRLGDTGSNTGGGNTTSRRTVGAHPSCYSMGNAVLSRGLSGRCRG